jgi:hypothetical protein
MKRTFAPGWTQVINTADPKQERADLLCYINDTHKAVYGYRPRWDREWADNVPMADLRKEADNLEQSVIAEEAAQRAREARRQAEMAKHHLAVSRAKKPISGTYKPFANLKEILV